MSKVSVRVPREDFIRTLEQVQPGLSTREIVPQSNCFVFSRGRVHTFNEEVACQAPSQLPNELKGAVQAGTLLDILRKIPDPQIRVETNPKHLVILGKNKRTRITRERDITLPIDSVEKPSDWRKLHPDYTDAVGIVQECASKDQTAFTFTCIHLHPDYMEACDNLQLTRYRLKTGVQKPYLVRRDSLKHIPSFDFTKICETPLYVHFKNKFGVIMSCRKYKEKFPDLTSLLDAKGVKTTLPKSLGDVAERCELFSRENPDDDLLHVELKSGRLQVMGVGTYGDHTENKKLKYDGSNMIFRIAPKMLIELLKRHTDCRISKKRRLSVDGGKFRYVVCLERAK